MLSIQLFPQSLSPTTLTSSSAEDRLLEIGNSSIHQNIILNFLCQGKSYPIRVIRNVNGIKLFSLFNVPKEVILASKEPLPEVLAEQLKAPFSSVQSYFGESVGNTLIFDELAGK